MVGELGESHARRRVAQIGAPRQGLGDAAVGRDPFYRAHVVVDGLSEQRMAEPVVVPVRIRDEDPRVRGRPQAVIDGRPAGPGYRHQEIGVHAPTDDGCLAHDLEGVVVDLAMRASSTSRSELGSGPEPWSASSSSTWNGLPSASATTRAALAASADEPSMALIWVLTSSEPSGRRRMWSATALRSSSATTGVSGWRRWSSSERNARTSRTLCASQSSAEERDHVERRAVRPMQVVDDRDDVAARGLVDDRVPQPLQPG